MPVIPPTVLKKLYVKGSLRPHDGGFALDLKNLIAPATITRLDGLRLDGIAIDESQVTVEPPSGNSRSASRISSNQPLHFPVGVVVTLRVEAQPLEPGEHDLTVHVTAKEIGSFDIPISDTVE